MAEEKLKLKPKTPVTETPKLKLKVPPAPATRLEEKPETPATEVKVVSPVHVQEAMTAICEALFTVETWNHDLQVLLSRPQYEPLRDAFVAQRKYLLELKAKLAAFATDHNIKYREPVCPPFTYTHLVRGFQRVWAENNGVCKALQMLMPADTTLKGKTRMATSNAAEAFVFALERLKTECPDAPLEPSVRTAGDNAVKQLEQLRSDA